MERIPNAGPWVTDKEVAYVADAARNAWYTSANLYNDRFEEAFARYVGVRHAISVPHCTSAIHLALMTLGIGPGDEVIVPELTWIATAAPITQVGATTIFADVDPVTLCISADALAKCISPRTRAVIPVDLYGGMPDWEALRRVANQYGVTLIEDAAESIGSEYHGVKAGALGQIGVFSFHGSKTLTTGEGGMFVTDDSQLYERAQFLRDHGRSPSDRSLFNTEVACKYKMSAMQAAFGLAQLERIDELVGRKREMFSWYQEELGEIPGLTLNAEPDGVFNSLWMTNVMLDPGFGLTKDDIRPRFAENAIDYRPLFHPLSSLPAFEKRPEAAAARERNRVAYHLSPLGVNLPSSFRLTREHVARVGRVLREALAATGKLHEPAKAGG